MSTQNGRASTSLPSATAVRQATAVAMMPLPVFTVEIGNGPQCRGLARSRRSFDDGDPAGGCGDRPYCRDLFFAQRIARLKEPRQLCPDSLGGQGMSRTGGHACRHIPDFHAPSAGCDGLNTAWYAPYRPGPRPNAADGSGARPPGSEEHALCLLLPRRDSEVPRWHSRPARRYPAGGRLLPRV